MLTHSQYKGASPSETRDTLSSGTEDGEKTHYPVATVAPERTNEVNGLFPVH